MRSCVAVIAVVCASCGRTGFDSITSDSGPGSDSDANDGAVGDAPADSAVPSLISMKQAGRVVVAGGGDITLALPVASTAGTLLVATLTLGSTNQFAVPAGWMVALTGGTSAICYAALAYYPNNPGGITGVTFTQGTGALSAGHLSEWSGVAPTSSLDQVGTVTESNLVTTVAVSTSGPITATDEVAIATFCQYADAPSYMPATGWTNIGMYSAPTTFSMSTTTDIRFGLNGGTISETQTSTQARRWAAVIATFRP